MDHSHKVTGGGGGGGGGETSPTGAIAGGVSIAVISVIAVGGVVLFVIVRTKSRRRRDGGLAGGLANNLGPDDNDSKARLDHPKLPKHKYIECFFVWGFIRLFDFYFGFSMQY